MNFVIYILLKTFILLLNSNLQNCQIIELNFTRQIKKNDKESANFQLKSNKDFLSYLDFVIPIDFNDKYQLIANLGVGNRPQYSEVLLDTGSNILWIAGVDCFPCQGIKNRFNSSQSLTYKNTSKKYDIIYGTGSTQGYLSYDDVHIGNLTIKDFKFLVSFDSGTDMFSDGILGLGNFYTGDDTLSLIDQLQNQGKISKRIFAQKLITYNKGILSIGDIPEEIKTNKNESGLTYGKCPCLSKSVYKKPNIYWECELEQVFFGQNLNNSIDVYSRINFDTGTNFILVPQFFLKKYIIDLYLAYYFQTSHCVAQNIQGFIHIICDNSLRYYDLGNFNFRFGGYVMILRPEELFDNYGPYIQFKISSSLEDSLDLWILGAPILNKFVMVFDKDNQEIGFFGEDVKIVGDIGEHTGSYFIFILFLLAILIILMIYILIRYFKEKSNNEIQNTNYRFFQGNQNRINDNSDF